MCVSEIERNIQHYYIHFITWYDVNKPILTSTVCQVRSDRPDLILSRENTDGNQALWYKLAFIYQFIKFEVPTWWQRWNYEPVLCFCTLFCSNKPTCAMVDGVTQLRLCLFWKGVHSAILVLFLTWNCAWISFCLNVRWKVRGLLGPTKFTPWDKWMSEPNYFTALQLSNSFTLKHKSLSASAR